MKLLKMVVLANALAFFAAIVVAEPPPKFYKNTYPEHALKSRLEAEGVLMGEHAKLNSKTRELIALGVSAQIPCVYCVYVHTKNARASGATEAEIREAVATAAHVRHWSTILNGMDYDLDAFKSEVDKMHSAK